MDLLFHFISGLVISKIFVGDYLVIAGIFAAMPDLTDFVLLFTLSKGRLGGLIHEFIKKRKKDEFYSVVEMVSYRLSHGFFAWVFVSVAFWIALPEIFWVLSLCYMSHIVVDIYTHRGDYATRVFYPVSDFHIDGKVWFKNKKIFFGFWLVLLMILILTFYS